MVARVEHGGTRGDGVHRPRVTACGLHPGYELVSGKSGIPDTSQCVLAISDIIVQQDGLTGMFIGTAWNRATTMRV